MLTTLDEIADGIYRISTFVPEVGPDGFTFNQFLLDAEEPLLYHTGMKGLFPLVSEEVARVRPVEQLRWIAFAHVEADECGAIEQFLAAAPNAQVAHGATGCMVSLNDMRPPRPPRPLADGETVDLGGKEVRTRRVRHLATPHVPHNWSRRSCSRRSLARCCAATSSHRQAIRQPSPPTTSSTRRSRPSTPSTRPRSRRPYRPRCADSRTAARHTGDHARRLVSRRRRRRPAGSC